MPRTTNAALLAAAALLIFAGQLVLAMPPAPGPQMSVDRGLDFLRKAQKKDGSWSEYPAITALAVSGFLLNGRTEQNDPAVAKGVQFILRFAKPNGSICIPGAPSVAMPSYNTSLCAIALLQTGNPAYRPVIDKAAAFLQAEQFAEPKGIKPSSPMYGGIGYGDDPGDELHPDLSNLQHALEALHACGVQPTAPAFKKALIYLGRVQNRRESNDQQWVKQGPNDGGFVYEAQGETKTAGGHHESYGAMTYAGIKSLKYCGVPASDPRVRAALGWISAHYSVTEHPGMGTASMFYYYRTMAMTLDAYGIKVVRDRSGKPHDWARELAGRLVSLQRPDGSWANKNARYWENRPDLTTSYGLIVLYYCRKNRATAVAVNNGRLAHSPGS
jgi:squalene-hopene/tetraprenyl-beta-curcumene cyclase